MLLHGENLAIVHQTLSQTVVNEHQMPCRSQINNYRKICKAKLMLMYTERCGKVKLLLMY